MAALAARRDSTGSQSLTPLRKNAGKCSSSKIPSQKTKARLSRAFAVVDFGSAYFASFAI
jgi:hypothetical protein